MRLRNMFYGALCGAVMFGTLSWLSPRKSVGAAVLSTPPAGRFQLVQLHPNADSEWSAILDTETGCTWVYEQNNADDPKVVPAYKTYLEVLGTHSLGLVNFDAIDYTAPTFDKDNQPDYAPLTNEISRVAGACSQARLRALRAAAAQ